MATPADQSAALGLSFTALCSVLKTIEATSKSDRKLELLFSANLRARVGRGDLYPLMRLILPQLDRERTYVLKEKKIAKLYIQVLGLAPISRDAQKLEHFHDPRIVDSNSVGDFAAVLYEVVLYRSGASRLKLTHTIQDVNELLDALVRADSSAARKQVVMKLVTAYTAEEQKWIVRVVLKDLKIGLRHERVLQFIHPDAMEMYNHTNDLHKVCTDLRNSAVRYVPQLEPFQVFTPMLAKRVPFGECIRAINADAFVVEPKLDGERITCHAQGQDVQFISRNGINYTESYAPSMQPHVRSQLEPEVDCILDGEMMVWDDTEYRLREFGLLKHTAKAVRKGEATNRWLCYVVWDVVFLGGPKAAQLIRQVFSGPGEVTAVMGLPLVARRKLLLRILKPLDHRLMIIEQKLINDKTPRERHERVMAEVDQQVLNGGEGVIMKDLHAHYMCGESSRKSKKWLKLKPDYAGMTTDLDTVIVGGFYGTGRRRSGNVSVFLLGVLAHALDETQAAAAMQPGAPCPAVYTFAKVGTGYNLDELEQMRQELEPYWQPWDDKHIPLHLNGWKPQKSDLRPDVWIDPRHSKILEVYGFELSFTTLYQAGLTIRFPRCKAIRHDKAWYECIDLQDLNAARGSLSTKRASEVALGQQSVAKRVKQQKTAALPRRASGVLEEYTRADLNGIEREQSVFEGMEFCVLPGTYEVPPAPVRSAVRGGLIDGRATHLSKQTVEKLLHALGGHVVQNPIDSTDYVVAASEAGFKVANLKKQGLYNIVHVRWVYSCAAAMRLVSPKASDFVFATDAQRHTLARQFDRYGDHFTEHIDPDDFRRLMHEVQRDAGEASETLPWQLRMRDLDMEEADAMSCAFTFLSHCVGYFQPRNHSDSLSPGANAILAGEAKLLEHEFRLYGGLVAHDIDSSVTHVVVDSTDQAQIEQLVPAIRALRHQGLPEPRVVTKEWVQRSVEAQMQLPVDDFVVDV